MMANPGSKLPAILLVLVLATPGIAWAGWLDLWLTPDQQGERLLDEERYAEAAELFTTPDRIGVAWFLAGDFEKAAAVLGRSSTAESAYNRGNALIMLGKYEDAISSYELALQRKPDWPEAEQNLEIARLRLQALAPPEDDFGGTGGEQEADEFVIDTTGRVNKSSAEEITEGGDQPISDEALRATWLRRVDTSPADFLAAKFAYQLAVDKQGEEADE
jgi:Ca-activated chloride channel family protein